LTTQCRRDVTHRASVRPWTRTWRAMVGRHTPCGGGSPASRALASWALEIRLADRLRPSVALPGTGESFRQRAGEEVAVTAYTVEIAARAEHDSGAEAGRMLVRVNTEYGSARITDLTLRGGLGRLPVVDLDLLLRALIPPGAASLPPSSDGPLPGVAPRMWATRRNGRRLRIRRATGRTSHTPNACRCPT
jgi:hypothetical protein